MTPFRPFHILSKNENAATAVGVMQDPFFEEDDGEFDDLYGNPPPSSPSRNSRHKQRNSEPPAVPIATPRDRASLRSPAASSSVVSRSYTRDRTGSMASTTTDLAASGKGKKRKKLRRKSSQELFDGVKWQTDAQVTRCGLCRSDFSLVRRKHHCRHCGRVICGDCSVFLFFEFSHRKHRVCRTCNNQLADEQEQFERESMAPGSNDITSSRVFEDSSEDAEDRQIAATTTTPAHSSETQHNPLRATFANAFASKQNGVYDEKTTKKQGKKERKERRKKEKQDRKRKDLLGSPIAHTPRAIVKTVEMKPTDNGAALFNADDTWFNDVPDQNAKSRANSDSYSVEEGAEFKGWRDRVKDTYTVESASGELSAHAPMAGSTLTAGITGNGYFSDQFRYDVAGPALGHDDDFSESMPRPKQQSAPAPYNEQHIRPTERKLVLGGDSEENSAAEPEFHPRLTFKDSVKDLLGGTKRRESSANKTKMKVSKARARGDQSMTLDELNPSYSSEDEPYKFTPTMPHPAALTPANPTYYDNDADQLVVDDSPGYFEATVAEREMQKKQEEQRLEQMVKDSAWVNSSGPPPSGLPSRFSSEQDSYTMVDFPSHTSNSPVGNNDEDGVQPRESGKGGFAGALKRFFGMKSKFPGKMASQPKPVEVPSTVAPPQKETSEPHRPASSENRQLSSTELVGPALSGTHFARHTVVDYGTKVDEPPPQGSFRYTVTGHTDVKSSALHFDPFVPSKIESSHDVYDVQPNVQHDSPKRRGTFDGLFDSPKNNFAASGADRYSTTSGGWDARVGVSSSFGQALNGAPTVGVSRFDKRRSMDEDSGFTFGSDVVSQSDPNSFNDSVDVRRTKSPASMSQRYGRNDLAPSTDFGFTWSSVQAAPGLGTATYAVPTSLQPRAIYDEHQGSSYQHDTVDTQSASHGNIMDDLKRGPLSEAAPGKESVDDIFAEFEEPNDYVFDPTTGGYVATKAPPHTAVPPQRTVRSESAELRTPRVINEITDTRGRDRQYGVDAQPVALSTTRAVTVTEVSEEAEVGDEVADIIVDKISSLEGELAALKQLIRNRKGNGDNGQLYDPRARYVDTRPRTRKESIFDNDSSGEEEGKTPSMAWPQPKREAKRRPRSKKHSSRKRKDSFAGLFDEDSDKETLGIAASYEALFQTGTKTKGSSEDEKSDDDADLAAKRPKTRAIKPRRRSSRKSSEFVSAGRESDSAPELSSLNGRRSKRVIKHKKRGNKADDDDMHFEIESEGLPKAVLPPSITTPTKQISVTEEDDPIDALFDSSNDRDVSRLYGGDDNMGTKEDKNELPISPIALVSKNRSGRTGKSLISTPNSDKESVTTSTSFAKMEFVATVTPDAATSAFGSRGVNDGDEDDNFSINWKRMRSTKLRRRGSQRSSTPSNLVGATPDAIDKSKELLLDPTLLDTRSTSIDASGDALGIPAEKDYASPTLMPVNKFVEGTVSFDRVSDGASVLSLDSNKHPELPSDRSSIEEKTSEEQDAVSLVTLDTILKVEETTPIVDTSNTLLADDKDYSDGEPRVLSVDSVKMRPHTADIPNVTDPTFDIFDMSTDMDFVSMAIPSVINTSTYEEETEDDGNDSNTEAVQGGGSDHSNAEPFSFEIKGPKKRVSDLEMPTSIRRAAFGPDGSDSSPLSPSSSAGDDNVAFGKYATSSVLSSRTPLIDGSVDDQEEVLASTSANTAVLGEVESQEFDTDWQRMQAKEKERKKKLQIKQRQAQRDKVLRKQGVSSKALSGDSTPHSLSRSKSKSGKKKKKDQGESSSQHKKSGRSSRKHRHREKGDSGHTDPPRSLTEL